MYIQWVVVAMVAATKCFTFQLQADTGGGSARFIPNYFAAKTFPLK